MRLSTRSRPIAGLAYAFACISYTDNEPQLWRVPLDFLWVATTSRLANLGLFREGWTSHTGYKENESHHVFLLHKPSEKWVGCFPVSNCVAALSVTADKWWIGLESFY